MTHIKRSETQRGKRLSFTTYVSPSYRIEALVISRKQYRPDLSGWSQGKDYILLLVDCVKRTWMWDLCSIANHFYPSLLLVDNLTNYNDFTMKYAFYVKKSSRVASLKIWTTSDLRSCYYLWKLAHYLTTILYCQEALITMKHRLTG